MTTFNRVLRMRKSRAVIEVLDGKSPVVVCVEANDITLNGSPATVRELVTGDEVQLSGDKTVKALKAVRSGVATESPIPHTVRQAQMQKIFKTSL